jgi:hypothetical protein
MTTEILKGIAVLFSLISFISLMKDVQIDCSVPTQIKYAALYEFDLAHDFVAAPALQAYSERVFSLCGDLIDRKRRSL